MLRQRRLELAGQVAGGIREVRADGSYADPLPDSTDGYGADAGHEIGLAIIQLKSEMLRQVDRALVQLHHGRYGSCVECNGDITAARLKALPFAQRCLDCERAAEQASTTRTPLARPVARSDMTGLLD